MNNLARMVLMLATVLLALSPGFNVEAATFNVSTPAEFQAALDTAKSNGQDDTINVAAGTYNITTRIISQSFENFSLTIQGAGSGSTILDGGNSVAILYIYSVGQVFIKDIAFRNGNTASSGGGLSYFASAGTVENCEFTGNSGGAGGGGAYVSASDGTITLNKNTFTNNTTTGYAGGLYATSGTGTIAITGNEFTGNTVSSSGYSGGGAYVTSSSGAINFTGNILKENSASSSGNGGGISAFSSGPITIVNNVFSNNSGAHMGGGASVSSSNAGGYSIINNTFVNNSADYGGGLFLGVYTIVNVYNNIIYENTATAPSGGGDLIVSGGGGVTAKIFNNDFADLLNWSVNLSQGNNINAPPKLTSDFVLQSDSPCINTGNNSAPSLSATDYAGNPRIFGGVVDMGAYEFFVSGPYVDLSVSNVDNPNRVLINQEVTYTVTITNLGTTTAASVTLTDTLPPTSTYVSATPTQGTCSESSKIVTCNIGAIASSAIVTVTIVISAPGGAGTITNVASASTPSYDPFPANNTASQDTTVLADAENVYLAKTGQGACYDQDGNVVPCTGTGQDGDTKVGVSWPNPRFTNNGDGTMTDNLTGLMWLKDANCMKTNYASFDQDYVHGDGEVYWQTALDFVAGMNSGSYPNCAAGHTDWHLPNINELMSLFNAGYYEAQAGSCQYWTCFGGDQWLMSKGFLNVDQRLWTSNSPGNSDYAWIFDLGGGYLIQDAKNDPNRYRFHAWPVRIANKTAPARVWKTGVTVSYYPGDDGAVQAGVPWPSSRFTDNLDGTVTDELTGLMWLKDANCIATQYGSFDNDDTPGDGNVTWQHALDFVKGMNNGTYTNCNKGYVNWRLPNIKELHSLVDFFSNPGYPPFPPGYNVFSNFWGAFWSSTSFTYQYSLYTTNAFYMMTGGFIIGAGDKDTTFMQVWPVRSNFGSDLSVSKHDSPDPVGMGNILTYTVTVTNHGPADATAVSLTDSLPAGVVYVSANSSQGPCSQSSGTVSCTIGDMASGATVTVTIVVNAPIVPGTIVNTAIVSCTSDDPNLANNTVKEKTWVGGAVTLTIIKDGNGNGTVTGPGIACGADCTQDFTGETDITLSAAADANSFFAGWAGDACFGASGDCNLTINRTKNIRAVFNSSVAPVNLPRTWQQTSYAAGDDGTIQAGAAWPSPRFTILYCDVTGPCENQAFDCDSNASTDAIIDNLTGLMWARDGDIGNMSSYGGTTWDGAISYVVDYVNGRVAGNGLCGYKDWRGPNANELMSLTQVEPIPYASASAWLAGQGFIKMQNNYWSSTSDASNPSNYGWYINLLGGGSLNSWLKYSTIDHIYPLPVRNAPVLPVAQVWKTGQTTSYTGDPLVPDDGYIQAGVAWPSQRFTDNLNGTVTDNLTGLMWTKDANLPNGAVTWPNALSYIANMNSGSGYGGYKDWRLPNKIELHSLTDFKQSFLPSGHPFVNASPTHYPWASTTGYFSSFDMAYVWSGVIIGYNRKALDPSYVWPVRSGTIPPPPSADLSISKSAPPDPISGGSSLTYTINVTNNGPGTAFGVTMHDTLPAGTAFVSSIPTTPTCTNAGGIVSCNLGSMANGAVSTITIVVTVPNAAGWIRNVATVSSTTNDPNSGDNTAIRDTRVYTPTDPDSDGVTTTEESGPNGTNPNYDGNNDGTADNQQTNVTSMHTFNGLNYVTVASANGTSLSNVQANGNPSPGNSPPGVTFPYGFFGFTVNSVTAGGSTTVTIYLPAGANPNTYYKYGPEPGNPSNHWYEFLYNGQTGAVISGNVITLYFVDGLRGDDDLSANGMIVDQGGPGFLAVDQTGPMRKRKRGF